MAGIIPEVWESRLQGKKYYGAYGPRDVLIIVSSESLEGPDIVPRQKGKLTMEDKDRLTSQSIPPESWDNDVKLMEARYLKEGKRYDSVSCIENEILLKRRLVMDRIAAFFNNSIKPGVSVNYIGPGRKHTGDWCFEDGFITFEDIVYLYTQHFTGKTLELYCNCSYSGQWVQACKEFHDKVGTQPCGHSARKTGVLLKVRASCKPEQIGSSLLYSARGYANDKNTGALIGYHNKEICPDQTTCNVDFTRIRCKKSPDEECALSPEFTFRKQRDIERTYLVRGNDNGRTAWYYVLLADDPDTIHLFQEKLKDNTTIDLEDYGKVINSGYGDEPPQSVKDWGEKISLGLLTIT